MFVTTPMFRVLPCVLILGALPVACVGRIEGVVAGGDSSSGGGAGRFGEPDLAGTGAGPGTELGEAGEAGPCQIAPTPTVTLRRLTGREYDNTVADLLGDRSNPARAFAPEGGSTGFDTAIDGVLINEGVAEQYANAAKTLAATAVANLPALLACNTAALGETTCARQFIARFGRRAFRRGLTIDEQARYQGYYALQRQTATFARAIELTTRALLNAPQFLYRVELGASAEVATRLSYFLWGTTPSDELLTLAESGGLATEEQVRVQAERMFAHDNGARVIKNFVGQWLALDRLDGLVRGQSYTPAVATALRQETETYFDRLVRERDADWRQLMTSEISFVNPEVAALYGLAGITGPEFREVARLPTRHRGFLTMPAILTLQAFPNEASPIHRGVFLREHILCEPHTPPPPNIDVQIPPADATRTGRQQLEAKTQQVSPCSACHDRINPPGFAFDHFDQLGRWRDTDGQKRPLDTTGMLMGTDVDGPFEDQVALIDRLASSENAAACFVTQWFRYGFARREADNDCALRGLTEAFAAADGNVAALIARLVTSAEFLNHVREVGP